MTHDELLEATKSPTYMNSRTLEHPYMVIRAVLELHKPFDFKLGNNILTSCEGCGEPDYPCQTIQAIEKELN
jgi:hypothetical protein